MLDMRQTELPSMSLHFTARVHGSAFTVASPDGSGTDTGNAEYVPHVAVLVCCGWGLTQLVASSVAARIDALLREAQSQPSLTKAHLDACMVGLRGAASGTNMRATVQSCADIDWLAFVARFVVYADAPVAQHGVAVLQEAIALISSAVHNELGSVVSAATACADVLMRAVLAHTSALLPTKQQGVDERATGCHDRHPLWLARRASAATVLYRVVSQLAQYTSDAGTWTSALSLAVVDAARWLNEMPAAQDDIVFGQRVGGAQGATLVPDATSSSPGAAASGGNVPAPSLFASDNACAPMICGFSGLDKAIAGGPIGLPEPTATRRTSVLRSDGDRPDRKIVHVEAVLIARRAVVVVDLGCECNLQACRLGVVWRVASSLGASGTAVVDSVRSPTASPATPATVIAVYRDVVPVPKASDATDSTDSAEPTLATHIVQRPVAGEPRTIGRYVRVVFTATAPRGTISLFLDLHGSVIQGSSTAPPQLTSGGGITDTTHGSAAAKLARWESAITTFEQARVRALAAMETLVQLEPGLRDGVDDWKSLNTVVDASHPDSGGHQLCVTLAKLQASRGGLRFAAWDALQTCTAAAREDAIPEKLAQMHAIVRVRTLNRTARAVLSGI